MRVGVSGLGSSEVAALRHLLYPYKVQVTSEIGAVDLLISGEQPLRASKPQVRMTRCAASHELHRTQYGRSMVELPSDLIEISAEKFEAIMNPQVALMYKLATGMRFQYNVVPSSIRSSLLRFRDIDSKLINHLANEKMRKILIQSFDLLGFPLERRNPPSVLITHDVDSEKGLAKASSLKTVEDALGIQSTWFLPSDEYPIDRRVAADLADHSTIGSHDVKHDGRLVHLRRHEELVERLKRSKVRLEEIFETEVKCFRSPLMQFNARIAGALHSAGYRFDFSVPCWEPVHAVTMGGFGVESVQRFEINGVIEFPLTLFQDHQVLEVLKMSTREAIRFWIDQARLIRELGGDVVLLVHPDYSFAKDLAVYKELLTSLLDVFGDDCYQSSVFGAYAGPSQARAHCG